MLDQKDAARVYDTILSAPGMNEMVKIDLKISRKNALLLSSVVEKGLATKEGQEASVLLANLPKDAVEELTAFSEECLQKAGLKEFSEKLKSLNGK